MGGEGVGTVDEIEGYTWFTDDTDVANNFRPRY